MEHPTRPVLGGSLFDPDGSYRVLRPQGYPTHLYSNNLFKAGPPVFDLPSISGGPPEWTVDESYGTGPDLGDRSASKDAPPLLDVLLTFRYIGRYNPAFSVRVI